MCQVKHVVKIGRRYVQVCNDECVHTPGDKRCTHNEIPANVGERVTRLPGESILDFLKRAKRG